MTYSGEYFYVSMKRKLKSPLALLLSSCMIATTVACVRPSIAMASSVCAASQVLQNLPTSISLPPTTTIAAGCASLSMVNAWPFSNNGIYGFNAPLSASSDVGAIYSDAGKLVSPLSLILNGDKSLTINVLGGGKIPFFITLPNISSNVILNKNYDFYLSSSNGPVRVHVNDDGVSSSVFIKGISVGTIIVNNDGSVTASIQGQTVTIPANVFPNLSTSTTSTKPVTLAATVARRIMEATLIVAGGITIVASGGAAIPIALGSLGILGGFLDYLDSNC